MDNAQLKKLCFGAFEAIRTKSISKYSVLLCKELGIDDSEIAQVKIEEAAHETDDHQLFVKKMIKISFSRLREILNQHLLSNGLIKIGQPFAEAAGVSLFDHILIEIGSNHMFKVKPPYAPHKPFQKDPLRERLFLEMIFN